MNKSDELRIWFFAREVRGMPVPTAPAFDYNYPPLIIWLHQLLQPLAEAQGRPLAVDAILDLRRIMLLFTVSGTPCFALLGRRCGGPLAGILAAALWAFEDDLISVSALAIAESLITPLLVLSVLLAVYALECPRRWWLALVSFTLGLVCFLGDFRWLVAVVPGIAALVWHAWHYYRPGWRRVLLWGIAGLALMAVSGTLILARLPARYQILAQETLGTHLWDLDGTFGFLALSVELIDPLLLLVTLLLALTGLFARHAPAGGTLSRPALLMVGVVLFLFTWVSAAIRPYDHEQIWTRYLIPPQLMIYVLLATLVAQVLSGFQDRRARTLLGVVFLFSLLQF